MHIKAISTLFLVLITLIIACKKESNDPEDDGHGHGHEHNDAIPNQTYLDTADCSGITATYNNDVKPILDASCAISGCHDAASAKHSVVLDSYTNSKSNFEAHSFLCSINHGTSCSHMPLNGTKLTSEQIRKITCWAKGNFVE